MQSGRGGDSEVLPCWVCGRGDGPMELVVCDPRAREIGILDTEHPDYRGKISVRRLAGNRFARVWRLPWVVEFSRRAARFKVWRDCMGDESG